MKFILHQQRRSKYLRQWCVQCCCCFCYCLCVLVIFIAFVLMLFPFSLYLYLSIYILNWSNNCYHYIKTTIDIADTEWANNIAKPQDKWFLANKLIRKWTNCWSILFDFELSRIRTPLSRHKTLNFIFCVHGLELPCSMDSVIERAFTFMFVQYHVCFTSSSHVPFSSEKHTGYICVSSIHRTLTCISSSMACVLDHMLVYTWKGFRYK